MSTDFTDRYLILGGGAAGIGIGKCFVQAGLPFDMVERDEAFGGNWNYGARGSKMYESTHLISSKVNTQYSGVPMGSPL